MCYAKNQVTNPAALNKYPVAKMVKTIIQQNFKIKAIKLNEVSSVVVNDVK